MLQNSDFEILPLLILNCETEDEPEPIQTRRKIRLEAMKDRRNWGQEVETDEADQWICEGSGRNEEWTDLSILSVVDDELIECLTEIQEVESPNQKKTASPKMKQGDSMRWLYKNDDEEETMAVKTVQAKSEEQRRS